MLPKPYQTCMDYIFEYQQSISLLNIVLDGADACIFLSSLAFMIIIIFISVLVWFRVICSNDNER